jgi:hypothetical protein
MASIAFKRPQRNLDQSRLLPEFRHWQSQTRPAVANQAMHGGDARLFTGHE